MFKYYFHVLILCYNITFGQRRGCNIIVSYIVATMADTNHNILHFGQSNSIVNNDIDSIYNDTLDTTTYDYLGEIDPDINQCLNCRSNQCNVYDQDI